MSFPIFNTTESLLAVILVIVAFSMWAQKLKFFKNLGAPLLVIITGIIMANLRIVPGYQDIYGSIFTYCVPLAISLYLLNMDLVEIKKVGKEPLLAMACAIFSVCLISLIFGIVFAERINEGWKIAGMFVGTYTGGSSNLTAIAVGLEASQNTIAAANAADYVVGMPTLVLMFAAPAIMAKSKWFQKKWPYRFPEEEYTTGSGEKLLGEEQWSIKDIAILLALAFSIVAISTKISQLIFPASFVSAGRILLISTISLIFGQTPAVKKLRGKLNLGLFFSMMFLVIIGFMVDIREFFGSTIYITLFCLCVIIFSIVFHVILMRLFKVKYEYMLLSITAGIADGPTAALVATGGGWQNLVGIGMLMGVIGAVCGNYVGIGIAYLVKLLLGL